MRHLRQPAEPRYGCLFLFARITGIIREDNTTIMLGEKNLYHINPQGNADQLLKYACLLKKDNPLFLNMNTEDILKSEEGWKNITQSFTNESFPKEFEKESYDLELEIDDFENIKLELIPKMFEVKPQRGAEFFADYLLSLPQKRKKEWKNRSMWMNTEKYESNVKNSNDDYKEEHTEFKIDAFVEIPDDMNEENFYKYKEEKSTEKLEYDAYLAIEDIFEIYSKTTSTILKQLEKNGDKDTILTLINYIESDYFSRYHLKEISDCMKKIDHQFSADFIGTMLGGDSVHRGNIDRSKILLSLLLELESVEEARKRINEKIIFLDSNNTRLMPKKCINQQLKESLFELRSFITPNHDKIAITNLQKFYNENIKFEEYEINQKMNAKEIALLQNIIGKNEKILELGCGTGRLFSEMQKAGYDISGIDFTPRHIELIREQIPNAEVSVADWHDTKMPDKSYDTVYSLGRNILHDYSFLDQVQTFREANRILKQGGKFIFDIPTREKGGYKEMVEEYAQEMKKRGIRNFRYGTIYDSPDVKNFATRYAFSQEDIQQLAQLAGFKIIEIKKETLETGKEDENLYFVLEKI